MARRKEAEELTRVTLNIYTSDYNRMLKLHPTIGAAKAIRMLIRNYLIRVDQRIAQTSETLEQEIDFE